MCVYVYTISLSMYMCACVYIDYICISLSLSLSLSLFMSILNPNYHLSQPLCHVSTPSLSFVCPLPLIPSHEVAK